MTEMQPMDHGRQAVAAPSARPWQAPSWLAAWRPTEPPPVSPAQIRAAIAAADQALAPASPEAAMVLLTETLELFDPPKNLQAAVKFCLEAVEDVPLDILQTGLRQVRLSCRWFPKPADLRSAMSEALCERVRARLRLRTALALSR